MSANPLGPPRADGALVREEWLGTRVLSYPGRVRTIVEALDRAVTQFPDGVALVTPEGTVTYAEFAALVEGAVDRLTEEGVRPGDRVAVALLNGLDITVAIWACARAGFLFLGLPTRLQPAQWSYMLEHSGAGLVLAGPTMLAGAREAAAAAGLGPSAVRGVADLLVGRRVAWRGDTAAHPFPDQDTVYGIVYTSGTTGRPKASQLVHRCTVHSAIAYVDALGLTGEDRTAVVFPLYYVTGHVAQITPMMLVGGASVTVAEMEPASFVQLLRAERITYLMVVPSIWPLLMRRADFRSPDLDHVRVGAFGGSPVPLSTIGALRGRLPHLELYDAYGLTENHSPATILLDHEFAAKPGSVGRPVPCAEVRVVDDDGHDVPVGDPGELWIRGPMITSGYFRDPEATAAAITEGWLHTGDVARLDDDGYVSILDRKKDMIMRGGNKVYSVELEYLLVRHPSIAEAAVVGIPDKLAYEAIGAFVVPADGHRIDVAEVQQWVATHMAEHAVPRHVRIVDTLPRNRTGKVEKPALREQLVADTTAFRPR